MAFTAEKIMEAHLSDRKATLASAGALYAVCMMSGLDQDAWPRINRAIMDRFAPDDEDAAFRKLEVVKTHAWRLAESIQ